MNGTDYELVHVYHLAERLLAGKNRIFVTVYTKSGDAYIPAGDMLATVVGHGIYGNMGSGRDRLSLIERVPVNRIMRHKIGFVDITDHMDKEVT